MTECVADRWQPVEHNTAPGSGIVITWRWCTAASRCVALLCSLRPLLQVSVQERQRTLSAGSLSISCAGADANRCAGARPGRGHYGAQGIDEVRWKSSFSFAFGQQQGTGEWLLVPLHATPVRGAVAAAPQQSVTG